MALYNNKTKYNFKIFDGGGLYNSAPYLVSISDSGSGDDVIASVSGSLVISDSGSGNESISVNVTVSVITDTGSGIDSLTLNAAITVPDSGAGNDIISSIINTLLISDIGSGDESIQINVTVSPVLDSGSGSESITLNVSVAVSDSGSGIDIISSIIGSLTVSDTGAGTEELHIGELNFYVDDDNLLIPLNVYVLRDTRIDISPIIQYFDKKILGKHGKINFGSRLGKRILELKVVTADNLTFTEKEDLKRDIAKYLNPVNGYKTLAFDTEFEKMYSVKFSGQIDFTEHSKWFEFTIPFKMETSYISGTFPEEQSGSGTLTNDGNVETPLVIEIAGYIENPEIILGDDTLTYTGIVDTDETLVIDIANRTVKLDGVNVLKNYSGGFPKLQPGNTSVTADDKCTFSWRARWV